MSSERIYFISSRSYTLLMFILLVTACGDSEPPFPGTPPERAIYGTPPPTVSPDSWFRDAKYWGAESYFYHSPHYRGNAYRRQAGVAVSYTGDDLRQLPFLSGTDPAFSGLTDDAERNYQEALALEAYEACRSQGLNFYYVLPFPAFPVQLDTAVRRVHPDWFGADGRLDLAHPELAAGIPGILQALKNAMPELSGVSLVMGRGNGQLYELTAEDLERVKTWLPPLLQAFSQSCQELGIQGIFSPESIWHNNKTRRETYEILNQYPELIIFEAATWPEETTRMPLWGFVLPQDSLLLDHNPTAVKILTDTEFLGKGQLPIVLPRWWQQLARQAYLQDVEIAAGRAFQGDGGGSATNFNRLNLHLLMRFLEDPRRSLKPTLHEVNEAMFGDDFPSRLTAIMLIAEDAIQAMSGVNSINLLDEGRFPPPQFLDRDYLSPPYLMKAIDDLFEPPGTPLYPEETTRPDTIDAAISWRWQREVSARPVDEYLLTIENAIDWLDKIQKEVQYLCLDLKPEHRAMFVDGYRDLLLMTRGMYQFVQGAAVHHRWYRLQRMSREEALQQLAPIAEQLRLIADEAGDSPMELQQRLLEMAEAYETLEITPMQD